MELQYKSFYWCLGTTSFRTKNFNKKIEQQLALLRDFWAFEKNIGKEWNGNNELQTNYYDFLHKVGFLTGNANNKPKDAREKTSGLVSLGLTDESRKLTAVGNELLKLSEQNNFHVDNILGIPADSFIYFKQLLKTSLQIDDSIVRPFLVTIYLIIKLGGLSYKEFSYLLPLSIDKNTTLKPNEISILNGINHEFNLNLTSLKDAGKLLEHQRYIRLNHLIDSKFTDDKILNILNLIATRNDNETQKLVTDNADIPTIFEYVLGILWYKISHRQGKILDYMKLSLDIDLLPKTHATGGEADIIYEYEENPAYPAHSLLIEATLTDRTNQRRMEMEPVSRHLGNHILKTKNYHSYCVFATNELNINVVSDFRGRKNQRYYDTTDDNNFIDGMKIIPLQIDDLKNILEKKIWYEKLYQIFDIAFRSELAPREWRETCIVNKLTQPNNVSQKTNQD